MCIHQEIHTSLLISLSLSHPKMLPTPKMIKFPCVQASRSPWATAKTLLPDNLPPSTASPHASTRPHPKIPVILSEAKNPTRSGVRRRNGLRCTTTPTSSRPGDLRSRGARGGIFAPGIRDVCGAQRSLDYARDDGRLGAGRRRARPMAARQSREPCAARRHPDVIPTKRRAQRAACPERAQRVEWVEGPLWQENGISA